MFGVSYGDLGLADSLIVVAVEADHYRLGTFDDVIAGNESTPFAKEESGTGTKAVVFVQDYYLGDARGDPFDCLAEIHRLPR
jgi:hypothetical protein